MLSSENEFEVATSGASDTQLVEASRLKTGSLLMMKKKYPCRVTSFGKVKQGKHGATKVMIMAKSIYTDK